MYAGCDVCERYDCIARLRVTGLNCPCLTNMRTNLLIASCRSTKAIADDDEIVGCHSGASGSSPGAHLVVGTLLPESTHWFGPLLDDLKIGTPPLLLLLIPKSELSLKSRPVMLLLLLPLPLLSLGVLSLSLTKQMLLGPLVPVQDGSALLWLLLLLLLLLLPLPSLPPLPLLSLQLLLSTLLLMMTILSRTKSVLLISLTCNLSIRRG